MILSKIKHLLQRMKIAFPEFPKNYSEFGLKIGLYILWYQIIPLPKSKLYRKAMYQYVYKTISPVLEVYKKNPPVNEHIALKKIDRIPVWICWLQGEDAMPELVKVCFKSLHENVPKENVEIYLITLENLSEYITLSESVMRKFRDGMISYAFFSDIVRYYLVRDYGGVWIDSTIYVSETIPDEWFNSEYFTMHMHKELCPLEPCEGKWTNFCFSGKKDNFIARYICDALTFFWAKKSRAPDYIFLDYILMAGYRNLPEMRDFIDAVPYNNENIWGLKESLVRPFDLGAYKEMTATNTFHKLAHQVVYPKATDSNQLTFYGYLFQNTLDKV